MDSGRDASPGSGAPPPYAEERCNMAGQEERTALSVRGIVKEYPGVRALDGVSIDFRQGEVHALMGENGAGKSTLIKTIAGAIQPDAGEIYVDGNKIEHMTTKLSRELGIAVIYQELMMIPALSAAENVFLGTDVKKRGLIDGRDMGRRAKEIFDQLGVDIDPASRTDRLSVAYQQMIEIARALVKNAKILIMDEPSAMLTEDEVQTMFRTVERLRESGVMIIYISHRLEEVFQISDRISIMRDGKYITTLNTRETNKPELIHYMVGRELTETFPEKDYESGDVGLEIKNFTGNGVRDISLSVRHGEILGLGGLVGAGRTELAQLIFGYVKKEAGEMFVEGKQVTVRNPKDAAALRIGLIPEDRKGQGLLLNFDLTSNVVLPSLPRLSKLTFVNKKREAEMAEDQRKALLIKTPTMAQKAKNLSGGNQQKVVLAKWLAAECDYLIFDEPTRGIDVGAKQEIYKLLRRLAADGKCIIMISSEMEELIGVSDRIIVLCEGKMTGELQKEEFNQDKILALASGEKDEVGA